MHTGTTSSRFYLAAFSGFTNPTWNSTFWTIFSGCNVPGKITQTRIVLLAMLPIYSMELSATIVVRVRMINAEERINEQASEKGPYDGILMGC